MKRFTFLMLALVLAGFTSTVVAQANQAIKVPADMQIQNSEKSGWIGSTAVASLDLLAPGYEYAIRSESGAVPSGAEVTTVKFFSDHENYTAYGITGTEYNIKIYEGGSFDVATGVDDITASGTEVYTQSYTASASGIQEVELTTAYTVGASEFWVAIENASASATAALWMGALDNSTEGDYVMVNDNEGTADAWTSVLYCVDQDCTDTGYFPLTLSFYYDDGGVYEETSDLETYGYLDNPEDQNWITELELAEGDSLKLYPVFTNNGPDDAADMINISVSIDGVDADNFDVDPVADLGAAFGSGAMIYFPMGLMSATDMNNADLEVFDVCFTITYSGTDDNPANDTECITVTRLLVGLDAETENALSVYPNPANNVLNIENAQGAIVSVYNMIGQELISANVNDNMQTINVSELPEGAYIVRIANGAEIKTQKLNIVR
jgi:hypothetical protein